MNNFIKSTALSAGVMLTAACSSPREIVHVVYPTLSAEKARAIYSSVIEQVQILDLRTIEQCRDVMVSLGGHSLTESDGASLVRVAVVLDAPTQAAIETCAPLITKALAIHASRIAESFTETLEVPSI